MGPGAEAAIPALVDALRQKGPMWSMAGVALSRMGQSAYRAVVPLAQDGDPGVRREAVRTIGKLAEAKADGGDGSPDLLRHLDDEDAEVRAVAAAYLGVIHRDAGAVVPALARASADPSALVRMNACNALAMFGAESAPAVPELRRALDDPDKDVRAGAERALRYHPPAPK
jgi:HEAT repeat protein